MDHIFEGIYIYNFFFFYLRKLGIICFYSLLSVAYGLYKCNTNGFNLLFPMQMQNRMAVLLCNLKPAKMRGVVSQAMVMCASSPDKVEILDPPSGAVPGDRVTFQGFPGTITFIRAVLTIKKWMDYCH